MKSKHPRKRTIIAAVSRNGVIGVDGGIPWRYPADLARFARLTQGGALIMGRHTWASLPRRPLPGRRNLVLGALTTPLAAERPGQGAAPPGMLRANTSGTETVERYDSMESALAHCADVDVWFIGGARVYAEAMRFADEIDLTYVPETVGTEAREVVYFPELDPGTWRAGPRITHEDDPRLERQSFFRQSPGYRLDDGPPPPN